MSWLCTAFGGTNTWSILLRLTLGNRFGHCSGGRYSSRRRWTVFFFPSPILCFRTVVNQAFVVQEFFLLLLRIEFFLPVFPQSRKREKERGKVSNIIRDPYQARQPLLRKRERDQLFSQSPLYSPVFAPETLLSLTRLCRRRISPSASPAAWMEKKESSASFLLCKHVIPPFFRVEIHTSLLPPPFCRSGLLAIHLLAGL